VNLGPAARVFNLNDIATLLALDESIAGTEALHERCSGELDLLGDVNRREHVCQSEGFQGGVNLLASHGGLLSG